MLTAQQHSLMSRLKETGVNMSSISRLAIRKFGDSVINKSRDDGAKSKRVVIYLEAEDNEKLDHIASCQGISKSEALRRLLTTYLTVNEAALNQLF